MEVKKTMCLTGILERRKSRENPMSFRIVLVGDDWLQKNVVGNFLLGRDVFETKNPSSPEKNHNTGFTGYIQDIDLTITNSADLFSPEIPDDDLKQKVKECMSLCAPGPHALVLVINPSGFDEKKRQRMEHIVNSFSKQAFQHSITFFYKKERRDQEAKKIIELCQGRVYQFWHRFSSLTPYSQQTSGRKDAFSAIQDTILKNKFSYISREKDASDLIDVYQKQLDESPTSKQITSTVSGVDPVSPNKLNLVLYGSSAAAKASAADLILGEQTEPSPQPSSVCVKREAEVCGRHVTLVLLPALGKTQHSEEAQLQDIQNYLSLCDLRVHAFLLVIHQGPLTDEDKEEMRRFKHFFGEEVGVYCQTVQTTECQQSEREYEGVAKDGDEILQQSHHILSHRSNVLPLLEKIERMRERVGGCYTSDMYITAQLRNYLICHSQLENMKTTIQALKMENDKLKGFKQGTTGDLRIVLLGKTGSGKSATGNTILGGDVFREEFSFASVTTVCQKETAMVNGRLTTVIDTPGLFDTDCDIEDTKKEIIRCIAMAAPGPHVFLLVIKLDRFTQEEKNAVKIIQEIFGKESGKYMLVLFTKGDELQGKPAKTFLEGHSGMKKLLKKYGQRYHVFNNRDKSNKDQVSRLLDQIDSLVKLNGGKSYTTDLFQDTEEVLKQEQERILKEREDQIKREKEKLQAKYEQEMEKLQKEFEEERKTQEEKMRRREEEIKYKMQDIEKANEQEKHFELEKKHKSPKQKEDEIKQQIAELQFAQNGQLKQLKKKMGEEQKKREDEEEQRKIKEMENEQLWDEKQKQEIEKLSSERERSALLEQHRQEKERYEREKQEEKQRREDEEEQRRLQEEHEIKQIELKYQRDIKAKEKEMWDLQEWLQSQLQGVEKESSERDAQQREEMEAELNALRQLIEEQKRKEAEASKWREDDMKWQREQYEREKEKLMKEAELAARKQAEIDFTEEMNKRVKEAKTQGHDEGYREGLLKGFRKGFDEAAKKFKKMFSIKNLMCKKK